MKILLIALLTFYYNISYGQEKVIIENKENVYNLKLEKIPPPKQESKNKKYKKHIKKSKYYLASKNGKTFHRPECKFAKRIKHKKIIKTRQDALKKGLKPCKFCKP